MCAKIEQELWTRTTLKNCRNLILFFKLKHRISSLRTYDTYVTYFIIIISTIVFHITYKILLLRYYYKDFYKVIFPIGLLHYRGERQEGWSKLFLPPPKKEWRATCLPSTLQRELIRCNRETNMWRTISPPRSCVAYAIRGPRTCDAETSSAYSKED